jgi:hypothetical protein
MASISAKASAGTVQKNVTQGAYCAPDGASGATSAGVAMTCKKDASGKDRWTAAVNPTASASAGQFCSPSGATATGSGGAKLVCKAGSDGRDRWTVQ